MRRLFPIATALCLAACSGDGASPTDTAAGGIADIDGQAYLLNVAGLSTPNADPDLATVIQLFFTSPVLLQAHGQTEAGFDIRMAFGGEGDTQDPCTATSDMPSATVDGSGFVFGPGDTTFYTTDNAFEVLDLEGSGTVSEDGTSLTALQLAGRVDLRQAVGFAGFDDVTVLCDTFDGLGLTCADCGDGSATCVDLQLAGMAAAAVPTEVQPQSPADAADACPTM